MKTVKANHLRKIEKILNYFNFSLPVKPYCSNDLQYGLRVLPQNIAKQFKYLQHNHPNSIQIICFDVDYDLNLLLFLETMPKPNAINFNKHNGRCHIFYILETPIHKNHNSSRKPIQFLSDVYYCLAVQMGADLAYNQLVSKNIFSDEYIQQFIREKPYTLNELADYIDRDNLNQAKETREKTAIGRNCVLFDTLRDFAYIEIRKHNEYQTYSQAIESIANKINDEFDNPLFAMEVRATVKSVTNYCWRNREYLTSYTKQKARSSKGVIARQKTAESRKQKILQLKSQVKSREKL